MGASDDGSGAKTRARGRPRRNGEESIQWTDVMAEALFKLRCLHDVREFFRQQESAASGPRRVDTRGVPLEPGVRHRDRRPAVPQQGIVVSVSLVSLYHSLGTQLALSLTCTNQQLKSVKTRCLQFAKQNALMGGGAGQAPLPHSVAIMRQYCGDDAAFLTPETAVVAEAAPSTRVSTRQSAREDTAASFHYVPGRTAAQVETPDTTAEGKKRRGRPRLDGEGAIQWTDELTDRLVQLRFETFAAEFDETKSTYRLRVVWTALAAQLGDEFGVQLGSEQCKSKTKALTLRWTQYCESINETNVAAEPHWVQTMRRYCGDSRQLEQPTVIPEGAATEAVAVAPRDLVGLDENDGNHGEALETPSKKKPKHDSGVKEKSLKWTLAMTERLFELRYKTMAAEFDRSQNKYRLRDAWKGLATQLSADCGLTIDVEHCRNKIKAMKTKWGGELNEQTLNAGNENNEEQGDWAGIWRRYCGDGGDDESNEERSTVAGLYDEARAANPARAGMTGDNNTTPLPPARRSSLNAAITRAESRSPVVPARWGRSTTNGPAGSTRNNSTVNTVSIAKGDENSRVLAQILRAVEEQKAAALAQTQSIQELLQFLREDLAHRQSTV
ncbi:hypothetical protein FI667_g3235, partial [Globisporangium splendens]